MTDYPFAALLRAVNAGGANRMLMADLRRLTEKLGFDGVRTYIPSGNLVFWAGDGGPIAGLEMRFEDAISREFGFAVTVMVRAAAELAAAVAALPAEMADHHPRHRHIAFLKTPRSEASGSTRVALRTLG